MLTLEMVQEEKPCSRTGQKMKTYLFRDMRKDEDTTISNRKDRRCGKITFALTP
jgi:hypothetical protein